MARKAMAMVGGLLFLIGTSTMLWSTPGTEPVTTCVKCKTYTGACTFTNAQQLAIAVNTNWPELDDDADCWYHQWPGFNEPPLPENEACSQKVVSSRVDPGCQLYSYYCREYQVGIKYTDRIQVDGGFLLVPKCYLSQPPTIYQFGTSWQAHEEYGSSTQISACSAL